MMKRKIVSIFAVFALLIALAVSVYAAETPAITASSVSGKPGDDVTVTVSMSGNPGIVSMTLDVSFDENALELTKVSDTGLMPGQMHTTVLKSPYRLTWSNDTATQNITVNGDLATLTFHIKDDASSGDTEIRVSVPRDGIYDVDADDVSFKLVNGKVSVAHSHTMVHVAPVAATCSAEGSIEYWHCSECGKNFKDQAGNTEATTLTTAIDANNHVGGTEIKNQKAATCTEPGNAGDTCCAACGAVLTKGTEIKALGHTGGTADCAHKAICTRCQSEYGEKDASKHVGDTEIRNQKAATCTEAGNTGDTCCASCGAVLTKGSTIKALGHTGGTADCAHKAICTRCKTEYGSKNASNHVGGTEIKNQKAATCTEAGNTGDTCCAGCGAVLTKGSAIKALGHTGGTADCAHKAICTRCGNEYGEKDTSKHVGGTEIKNQKAATCTEPGNAGDTCCAGCGAVLTKGESIQPLGHTGGTADCAHKAICTRCEKEYGELGKEHKFDESWKQDSTSHWHLCTVCNIAKSGVAAHDFNEENVCRICEYKKSASPVTPTKPSTPAENEKRDSEKVNFADIKEEDYFFDAVQWAAQNGVTKGTGEKKFSPMLSCTRAQVVTFLWRAAGAPEPLTNENSFNDVKQADYYYKAVLWAAENDITRGTSETTFSPEKTVTRAQVVTFLFRMSKVSTLNITNNPFKDVKEGAYYYDAVLWAVENGITKGISKDTFGTNEDCTRAQIVTFLYRYFVK